MFGLFKKRSKTAQALPKYADVYETMLYRTPPEAPTGVLPTIYAFRVKDPSSSPDPRPDFVLLESDEEIQKWQQTMAGSVVLNEDGQVTDAPLLRWNDIPSLLTSDGEVVTTYLPVVDNADWPALALQAHPFGTALAIHPARDRYYFEQNKVVGFL
tara:strand:+ start:2626 stop:3093 length:468 start_codon:yes stop_codon:yes gene_type:complete